MRLSLVSSLAQPVLRVKIKMGKMLTYFKIKPVYSKHRFLTLQISLKSS